MKRKYKKLIPSREKELKKIANKHFRRTLKHFEKDGWDLNFSGIVNDIMYDFLGSHISDELYDRLAKKGFGFKLKKYTGLCITDATYEALYYDSYEDKFVIMSGDYDVMKYREANGYVCLGRL